MAGRKSYVTPGFIAAMVVLGASGVVIVMVAATFITWCVWRYYRYLRQPSGMAQMRNRIRETDSIRAMSNASGGRGGTPRDGVGVPPGFIQSLPLLRYSKSGSYLASLEIKSQISDCPVCLTEYKEAERVRLLPNCKHMFHPICISTWLESHTTCPLCRSEVQVPKNAKNASSLEKILTFIRRNGGAQIVDSSARDRYSGRQQRVTVTPPPQTSGLFAPPLPPLDPRFRSRSLEFHELSLDDIPLPSSSAMESGMIFSSVWGPHSGQCSFSSSSGGSVPLAQVSVTIETPDEACSSATGFVPVSLDTEQSER